MNLEEPQSLTKPGPFLGFGSKSVVFCLFLDINCGVEIVESEEMDEGLSFGASKGCLVVLGDFLVCLLRGQVLVGTGGFGGESSHCKGYFSGERLSVTTEGN